MEIAAALTPGMERGKKIKVAELVDESFVRELDQEGFYRALYQRYKR